MNMIKKIKQFVTPYYQDKDMTHDLSHIERVHKKVQDMKARYHLEDALLDSAIYFHGIVKKHENEITSFLKDTLNFNNFESDKIIQLAKESHKSSNPQSLEGEILHDAHILEGGPYFFFLKNLITGTLLGQSIHETLGYFEKNILNKVECCLEENKQELEKYKTIAKKMLNEVRNELDYSISMKDAETHSAAINN